MPKLKNCPKKIRIAGYDYDIYSLKTKQDVEHKVCIPGCIGAINTQEHYIVYPEDINDQQNINTLLHEVIHGVIFHYTVPISEEDNEIITQLLLLRQIVHALLSNVAIICSDILPYSPVGVATTDVVASCKSLWQFSGNYGANHMVIHKPFGPLCSEHQYMGA